ncbi:MAG: tRNA (adenosine(37)-N6)-threonylcarbamoyltransferase complex ATPase subunit type 1 TsaE [Terrimicrobiaceae bacterium]|nr:tRNA (adenosine(37)-N6)-threonylcarbamoyltransferase complex ATPase subunit type 1 TsaE [Terrimicrobiaceae bacterium]
MTNAKPPHGGLVTNEMPIPVRGEAACPTPEATQALGARFAHAVDSGAVLSLEGPLGAGKTQFVKGFAAALGCAAEASSPTFTLVHEYAGGRTPVIHFDWYRLDGAEEVAGLGWEDYLAGGETLLVEWGDRFPEVIPSGAWRLRFEINGDARMVRWERTA